MERASIICCLLTTNPVAWVDIRRVPFERVEYEIDLALVK